jgi:hypothetical protein
MSRPWSFYSFWGLIVAQVPRRTANPNVAQSATRHGKAVRHKQSEET